MDIGNTVSIKVRGLINTSVRSPITNPAFNSVWDKIENSVRIPVVVLVSIPSTTINITL